MTGQSSPETVREHIAQEFFKALGPHDMVTRHEAQRIIRSIRIPVEWQMSDGLTFGERFLLYMLVGTGPRYDNDSTEDRVLINRGLAERYPNPITGHTMVRVTEAGKKIHDDAWPSVSSPVREGE